jgi:hypothetical protein
MHAGAAIKESPKKDVAVLRIGCIITRASPPPLGRLPSILSDSGVVY